MQLTPLYDDAFETELSPGIFALRFGGTGNLTLADKNKGVGLRLHAEQVERLVEFLTVVKAMAPHGHAG